MNFIRHIRIFCSFSSYPVRICRSTWLLKMKKERKKKNLKEQNNHNQQLFSKWEFFCKFYCLKTNKSYRPVWPILCWLGSWFWVGVYLRLRLGEGLLCGFHDGGLHAGGGAWSFGRHARGCLRGKHKADALRVGLCRLSGWRVRRSCDAKRNQRVTNQTRTLVNICYNTHLWNGVLPPDTSNYTSVTLKRLIDDSFFFSFVIWAAGKERKKTQICFRRKQPQMTWKRCVRFTVTSCWTFINDPISRCATWLELIW